MSTLTKEKKMTNLTKDQLEKVLTTNGRNAFMTEDMKNKIHSMVSAGKKVKEIAVAINEDARFKGQIKDPKQTYNRIFNYLKRQLKSFEPKKTEKPAEPKRELAGAKQ
jgi:hypothetical protein